MNAIVLDTRALEVLADSKADRRASKVVHDILAIAKYKDLPVRVPTAVLAEAYRGTPEDAAINRVLKRNVRPITFGQGMARHAGGMKYRDKLNSCHIVDAAVVATAIRLGGGIIITGDADDLTALAREHPNIEVHGLS